MGLGSTALLQPLDFLGENDPKNVPCQKKSHCNNKELKKYLKKLTQEGREEKKKKEEERGKIRQVEWLEVEYSDFLVSKNPTQPPTFLKPIVFQADGTGRLKSLHF